MAVSPPLSPLIGQPQAVELLSQSVLRNRVAPAYLFVGTPGTGRRLAAQCFLELLLIPKSGDQGFGNSQTSRHFQTRLRQGNHPDVLWVEPTYTHQGKLLKASEAAASGVTRKSAPQIRLEQIRGIIQFLGRPPLEASRTVVVLEQAETMAEAAANALLKTLEEPGQATLILIAPSPESLLPTLVSRCQRIPFCRLNAQDMAQILQQTGYGEILNHPEMLAIAQGSPGGAIAAFEQLQAIPPDLLQALRQPPSSWRVALDLARQIDKALETEQQLWLIDYLEYSYWQSSCQQGQPSRFPLQYLEQAKKAILSFSQPRLVWEVTLMSLCQG